MWYQGGLSKKVTFQQISAGEEGNGHVALWGKSLPDKELAMGPQFEGACCVGIIAGRSA